ncbi:MAG: 16S rRNA (uracil(1498)-N(3))-methyltransferase [Puniceicoccales bacterium]|jgi:16S rRNA (uracil1498-N3)-methyltransferase|nr:16S rRNA (uracil(1498)-N(3))-methyltransferase [Puniceicoccales bacterium]
MALFFVFSPMEFTEGVPLTLLPEESHHIFQVLRAGAGDELILFDGSGKIAPCQALKAGPRVSAVLPGKVREHLPPPIRLHLLQGIVKSPSMEDILRRGAELGVAEIHPILCRHCAIGRRGGSGKLPHWKSIAVAACKQSKNPFLPSIHSPLHLATALESIPESAPLIAASLEPGALSWGEFCRGHLQNFSKKCGDIFVAVGPEGDFSPDEYALLRRRNCTPVRLGPRILTAETAALTLLGALQFELECTLA